MATTFRIPLARIHQGNSSGFPLAGAKLYCYENLSVNQLALFSDYTGSSSAANPIVADSAGRFPIRYTTWTGRISWVLKDADGATIWSDDNISTETNLAGSAFVATGSTTAISFPGWAALVGLWPEQFGAVGDGSTDDNAALIAWLTAVQASSSRIGRMQAKTYATSASIGTISTSHVQILGAGAMSSHDVGGVSGTILKAITNTGFTILTVAPTEGGSAQALDSVTIEGVSFHGNDLAAKGLFTKSIRRSRFNVFAMECTTSGIEIDVSTTLGEARDSQRNIWDIAGRQVGSSAPSIRLKGDGVSANTSLNMFRIIDLLHYNSIAVICENCDKDEWEDVRIIKAGGGSASYSMEFRGGATITATASSERVKSLSSTMPAIVRGLASYAVPAWGIRFDCLDRNNGTPDPVVEAGATCIFGDHSSLDSYGPFLYNLAVNGDFALNQLAPSSNTDKTAGFDGGVVLVQTGAIALTSVSAPEDGQPQCLRMTQSQASAQRMAYLFVIPSEDTIPLRGKGIAAAIRARFSVSADIRMAIGEWTGTADALAGDVVSDWTSTTYTTAGFFTSTTQNVLAVMETACTSATWRNLSGAYTTGGLTATVGSTANNLWVLVWTEGTAAQNVTLDLGLLRIIPGYMPNSNLREDRAQCISRCERQVEKSYTIGVAPATSSDLGSEKFVSRAAVGDQLDRAHVKFRTRKIGLPTVTVYSTTGATANIRNITDASDLAAAADDIGDNSFNIKPTANTTAEKVYGAHWAAVKYPWV